MVNVLEVQQLPQNVDAVTLEKLASQGVVIELPVAENLRGNLEVIDLLRRFLLGCTTITLRQVVSGFEVLYAYQRNESSTFDLVGEPKVVRTTQ